MKTWISNSGTDPQSRHIHLISCLILALLRTLHFLVGWDFLRDGGMYVGKWRGEQSIYCYDNHELCLSKWSALQCHVYAVVRWVNSCGEWVNWIWLTYRWKWDNLSSALGCGICTDELSRHQDWMSYNHWWHWKGIQPHLYQLRIMEVPHYCGTHPSTWVR